MQTLVDLDKVSLSYTPEDSLVLAETSLRIQEGEFVAIVGPSGCGKSTILKLISGLISSQTGDVLVEGKAVKGAVKIVGLAFQNPTLLPWRTTLDNVLLPLEVVEPHRFQFKAKKQEYIKKAKALLNRVGLSGAEEKFPWELSGGMQQRANLCRALIHEPKLLLLDEPFGALDAFTREELWGVLRDLWQLQKFTVVLVTHDLQESVFLADTVYVMSARPGRILFTKAVDLPRPRTLEHIFEESFVAIVHELREHISIARQGT